MSLLYHRSLGPYTFKNRIVMSPMTAQPGAGQRS
jgi:2,4-dienoyl-CoA reductase-like NADH-dependent reductase (Old Yellow Enzyme family)